MRFFPWFSVLALTLSATAAEKADPLAAIPAEKPVCNAANHGRLWPEGTYRPQGKSLEVCTRKVWKYRWQSLTVDVAELKKSKPRQALRP